MSNIPQILDKYEDVRLTAGHEGKSEKKLTLLDEAGWGTPSSPPMVMSAGPGLAVFALT